jgi:hypothetical protein
MDDANPKKPKPLSPRQQLKNVTDALAEDALADKTPLTKRARLQAQRLREKIIKQAEDHEAKLDWEAGGPEWKKRAKKKAPPDSGYVM